MEQLSKSISNGARDHFKNGENSKSLMSRENLKALDKYELGL